MRTRGLSASRIARDLGIPRSTIRDWLDGRVPSAWDPESRNCAECGNLAHEFAALPHSYTYLLGVYLGDGSISLHPRGVYKLRLSLDPAYPRIIDEAAAAMREVVPASKATSWLTPSRATEVYSYSKSWPCLFPQHGPGKKHHRRIALSTWQERLVEETPHLLLRGLIHSDGCRFMNSGRGGWSHPRYSFTNFSPDIRRVFMDACDLLALHWTTSGNIVYVSRKADVARMDGFIGPKA